jgi:hypothetical protein
MVSCVAPASLSAAESHKRSVFYSRVWRLSQTPSSYDSNMHRWAAWRPSLEGEEMMRIIRKTIEADMPAMRAISPEELTQVSGGMMDVHNDGGVTNKPRFDPRDAEGTIAGAGL